MSPAMNAGHSAQPATPISAVWKRSARPIASSTLCSESCSTSTCTISVAKDIGSSCLPSSMTTPIDLATSPLGISVLPHATKTTECSVRQHATDRARYKKLVRDAAEDPFPQSTVPVAAGHDQICLLILNETQEFASDRPPCLPPDLVRSGDSMAEKVPCDVGKRPFGPGVPFAFADSDEKNLFGPLQKRKCITYGAAALTCVFPRHDHPAELQRSDGVGHYQHGPARP